MTETNFLPHQDLDGLVTKEELDARIVYLNEQAALKDMWSAQHAGRSLWLESQYQELWDDLEKDSEGRAELEESDYLQYMESQCEDYALADVYENGDDSLYSWMVWCVYHEQNEFYEAVNEYRLEQDLPIPEWVEEDEMPYFTGDED